MKLSTPIYASIYRPFDAFTVLEGAEVWVQHMVAKPKR